MANFKLYVFFLIAGVSNAFSANAQTALPSDNEIREILKDRVDVMHKSVGIVVGILLRPSWPLETSSTKKKAAERKILTLDTKILDSFTGKYQPAPPEGIITIERNGNMLVMKSNTTPPEGLKLYAESEIKFFIKEADLQITFNKGNNEEVKGLTLRFVGVDYDAPRVP